MFLSLTDAIPDPVVAVMANYQADTERAGAPIQLYVGRVWFLENFRLRVWLPNGHHFQPNDLLTVHLDNRTGVDTYDAELKVYRTSYKGRVSQVLNEHWLLVECRDFSLVHGFSEVLAHREKDYAYPPDARPLKQLPVTPLTEMPALDLEQHSNKIGVLVTRTPEQPHTTAMAFLSTRDDDIFIISFPSTFKVQLLQRNSSCCFAIDERANFTFDHAIEWNYTFIDAIAYEVPVTHPIYEEIKAAFIEKNPWEVAFFDNPDVRVYHLKCQTSFCSSSKRSLVGERTS